uniref:Nucleolar protein 16 n=1 Tax=Angiostrongylus cantonensis TaxID=6313 RepID=A0A158P6N4_ANGCA
MNRGTTASGGQRGMNSLFRLQALKRAFCAYEDTSGIAMTVIETCFKRNLMQLTKKASVKIPAKKAVSEKRKRVKRQNQSGDEIKAEKTTEDHFVVEFAQKEYTSLNVKLTPPSEDFNEKYEMVLEKLAFRQNASEAREYLSQEVEFGNIEESDIPVIMQKWRQRKREKAYQTCKEKLINMEGTLEDVKVTGYVYNRSR